MNDFVPFKVPKTTFHAVERGKSGSNAPELVVPIRAAELSVRLLNGVPPIHPPRAVFPREEPLPPPPPEVPAGPTPEQVADMVREAELKGYRRGKAELQKELDARVEQERRFQAMADSLDAARSGVVREAVDLTADLVVLGLRRLVSEVPELLEGLLQTRLQEAAAHLVGAREVLVRVAPRDEALARKILSERPGWKVVGDPSVRGGCIAASEGGELDGSLDTALQALGSALEAWRAEQAG